MDHSKPARLFDLVAYQDGSVVSREIVNKKAGTVTVRLGRVEAAPPPRLRIEVADTGIGMTLEELGRRWPTSTREGFAEVCHQMKPRRRRSRRSRNGGFEA